MKVVIIGTSMKAAEEEIKTPGELVGTIVDTVEDVVVIEVVTGTETTTRTLKIKTLR